MSIEIVNSVNDCAICNTNIWTGPSPTAYTLRHNDRHVIVCELCYINFKPNVVDAPKTSYKFEIPGRLPGLNEIVAAAKKPGRNYKDYSNMKREDTELVAWCAKLAKVPKLSKIFISVLWIESNTKRDKDNIAGGMKFICDGLKMAEVIKDDGWKNVEGFIHAFDVDKANPRIIVEVQEVG